MVEDTPTKATRLFCTFSHEKFSVQSLQGRLRMAQLTACALSFTPSKTLQAPAFPLPKRGLHRPLPALTRHCGVRMEGRVPLPPSSDGPHWLGFGSRTITARGGLPGAVQKPFPYSGSRRGSPESGSSTRACICRTLGPPRTPDTRRSPGERREREEEVTVCTRVVEHGVCASSKANGCLLAALKKGLVPK